MVKQYNTIHRIMYISLQAYQMSMFDCHTCPESSYTNQINFIGPKSSHRTVTSHIQYTNTNTQSYREQYTVYKYVHVKHNYHGPIITLDKCIRHILVGPLYIMGVKR